MIITEEEAADLLLKDGVVALPTETVYGLAASYLSQKGVETIFSVKHRPKDNPLIVHIGSMRDFEELSLHLSEDSYRLTQAFWPGPLTLVVEANFNRIPDYIRADLSTVAFRMPSHPIMRRMIERVGPLVAPSANLSGKPSSTCAQHIEDDFGKDFPVVDGGVCDRGVESTILISKGDKFAVGRLGALTQEAIAHTLGYTPELIGQAQKPLCPGMRYKHYAPEAELHLQDIKGCEAILGFDERASTYQKPLLSLGSIHHPEEALKRLYALLRFIDKMGMKHVAVDVNFEKSGYFETLYERLLKASGKI